MPEINLPTAAKQNDIQTRVADVQSKTNAIQTTVNNIVSNFPLDISGGTDWSRYMPYAYNGTFSEVNELTDVFSINGPGFLSSIEVSCTIPKTIGKSAQLEILVDGTPVVSYTGMSAGNGGNTLRYTYSEGISVDSTNIPFSYVNNPPAGSGGSTTKVTFSGGVKLFFEDSLVIKIKSAAPNATSNHIKFTGGIKS